jgi:hypothetical protein
VRLFAYWDRPQSMPAYLQLCVATWQVHGGVDEVCLITNANLRDWVPEGVLDMAALRDYPICQHKTAIELAVLARYGGFFIDLDMICAAPLVAIQQALAGHDIALYGFHLALVGARPGSAVVRRWLELLQQTLAIPRDKLMAETRLNHIALGNYSFELLRDELATGKRAVPGAAAPRYLTLWRKWRRHRMLTSKGQNYIAQIDPYKSGYIAEHAHRRRDKLSARERYESFWFDEQLPLSAASANAGALVALHHSWTPPAYAALGFAELARDQALLSRYLRSLLGPVDSVDLSAFMAGKPAGVSA